uniref:Reverse transcriptase domain-containing protein n=1 Tax=Tanacetum cinerariifolium TaxID=118510 RepID=A0A6L2JZW5_TANCI|nr:reverse transcriptase domain-containing protein [Tanacetum cinerariifolium]
MEFTYALRFRFDATNNEAEYEALISRLRIAEQMGVKNLQANVLVEELKEKSINEIEILAVVEEEGDNWMTLLFKYLTGGTLPADGIDIAGPFSKGPRKVKFLIVAMDYFTKWIEAKPVMTITGNQIKNFVWDNIVYRFGLHGEITQIMEISSGTIRSKIGAKNYVSANTLLPLNIRKPMASWKE